MIQSIRLIRDLLTIQEQQVAATEALTHAECVLTVLLSNGNTSTNNMGRGPHTSTKRALDLCQDALAKLRSVA